MLSTFSRALSAIALSGFALVTATPTASAVAETNGIALYFSAPFVQGTSFTGADVATETFNSASIGVGGCLGASAVGEITTTCQIRSGDSAGGASLTTDTPTIGGTASLYAATPWPSGGAEIEIIFPEDQRYIGLWWTAGNVESSGGITNFIEFYNGEDLLVTMTANQVMDVLGGLVPNPYPGSGTLDSVGGGTHNIGYYYGHPATHASLTPTAKSSWTSDYPFVFLNLFTEGATTVDRVIIGGDGFEFDNFTTSTLDKTPTSDMVFVAEYLDTVTPPVDDNSGGGDSGGGDSGGGGGDGGSGDGDVTTEGSLAATGFDPLGIFSFAAAALFAGVVILRRRQQRQPRHR